VTRDRKKRGWWRGKSHNTCHYEKGKEGRDQKGGRIIKNLE
jgi:hypothetical protein